MGHLSSTILLSELLLFAQSNYWNIEPNLPLLFVRSTLILHIIARLKILAVETASTNSQLSIVQEMSNTILPVTEPDSNNS